MDEWTEFSQINMRKGGGGERERDSSGICKDDDGRKVYG